MTADLERPRCYLLEPATGECFHPVKMIRSEDGTFGFRVLARGSNKASDEDIVETEDELIAYLRDGRRVRCVSGITNERNAYSIGGKRKFELVLN